MNNRVVKIPWLGTVQKLVPYLIRDVQMQGARVSRSEAYFFVGRNDANGAQRSIWTFACVPFRVFQQPFLRHFKNLHSCRSLKLEHFLRQSRIEGNIGKFQRGGITHNIIEAHM